MSNYEFAIEYIRILKLALERGCAVAEEKQKILHFEKDIRDRLISPTMPLDGLERACNNLKSNLYNVDGLIQDTQILEHLGIRTDPCLVLYDSILGEQHLVGYTAYFVDDATDCSREESVWFDVGVTYKEALKQTKKQFSGMYYAPAGLHLAGRIERHTRQLSYRGYIFTINLKEE